jgi:hypothetical protein
MELIQPHLGYYVYNDKAYYTRNEILDEMILNQDYEGKIHFNFNDDVYRSINWRVGVPIGILRLYQLRAQQLRDKYKYLILMFSGGSDSSMILRTFLNHNIFIDEIRVHHYDTLINKADKKEIENNDATKTLLEYRFAALPIIKEVIKKSPKTKIVAVDDSDFLIDQVVNKKFEYYGINSDIQKSSQCLVYHYPRFQKFSMTKLMDRVVSDKDKVCVIQGIEKPGIYITENDHLCFKFSDIAMHGSLPFRKGKIDPNLYIAENFFWSRDMPLIPIAQAQLLKRAMESDYRYYKTFKEGSQKIRTHEENNRHGHSHFMHLERIMIKIIYPDHNFNVWQPPKSRFDSPELSLLKLTNIQHENDFITKEMNNYYLNKYEKIANKHYFRGHIYTEPYVLGKIKVPDPSMSSELWT